MQLTREAILDFGVPSRCFSVISASGSSKDSRQPVRKGADDALDLRAAARQVELSKRVGAAHPRQDQKLYGRGGKEESSQRILVSHQSSFSGTVTPDREPARLNPCVPALSQSHLHVPFSLVCLIFEVFCPLS